MLNKVEFGKRLKRLRGQLNNGGGMTQADFAKEVGVTAASISAYELGTKTPNLEIAFDIAKKFKTSIDLLCGKASDNEKDVDFFDSLCDERIPLTKILPLISFLVESGICSSSVDYVCEEYSNDKYAKLEFTDYEFVDYIDSMNQLLNVLSQKLLTQDIYEQSRNGVISKNSSLYWDCLQKEVRLEIEDDLPF